LGQVKGLCVANVPCPKCGETKPCRGCKPEHGFVEPEPPEQGGEQLLFVIRRAYFNFIFSFIVFLY